MGLQQAEGTVQDPAVEEQAAALIRQGEETGCVELSEIGDLTQSLELDDDQVEALLERLESQGIQVTDDCGRGAAREPTRYQNGELAEATTSSLQLFFNEVGRHP